MIKLPSVEPILAEIEAWFAEHIARAAIARNVEAYNQAFHAKDALKARIEALFAPPAEAAPRTE